MKNIAFLLAGLFLVSIIFVGCGDDEDQKGNLTINYNLLYDGEPFVMEDRYTYNGKDIAFTRVSFFMSNLELFNSANQTLLKDVDYLDFFDSHATLSEAIVGYNYSILDLDPGSYTGLSYNIGVPSIDNAKQPSDFSSPSALAIEDEYWADWGSYIFVKIEALADQIGDGVNLDLRIRMHLGSDAAFRRVELPKSIEIVGGQTTQVNIDIDVKDIFISGSDMYDFEAYPVTHSLSLIDQINFVADGIVRGTKVQ